MNKRRYISFFIMLIVVFCLCVCLTFAESYEENEIRVSNETWKIRKYFKSDGEAKSITYLSPEGTMFDEEDFKKVVSTKLQTNKIEPAFSEAIQLLPPETLIRVIITLKDQSYGDIKRQTEERYRPQIENLRSLVDLIRLTQSEEQAKDILREIRSINNSIMVEAYMETKARIESQQMALSSHIESIGGKVIYRYTIVNALSAFIPSGEIERLLTLQEIVEISEDSLIEANLNVSIPSLFADTWWNNGYTGGIYNVAIVDSGMDTSHPAFLGKTFVGGTFHATGSTNTCYDDNPASADDFSGHGTHVGGIVMSQGAAGSPPPPGDPGCINCKGVARGLNQTFNLKAGWRDSCSGGASMYFSDAMAAVDWAESQSDPPDVYNLSYGGSTSSDDSSFARFWDAIVSTNGKPVALSAGNSGPSNIYFNDPAISYNAVTVANINDFNNTNRSDDKIRNSSTRGPTASGRKKPDIAAPGTLISSTNAIWEVDYDFVEYTGTSMAAPHIAGAFILLQNYLGSGMESPLRGKALLINTADSWSDQGTVSNPADDGPVSGKHWDRTYGWGYLNLNQAFIYKDDTFYNSLTTTNRHIFYKGHFSPFDKATVVWNRRVLYNDNNYPVTWYVPSDIDLYLRRETDDAILDTSSSIIDNVEQVSTTSDEDVVLKVKLISTTIDGAASEPYGLAVNGSFSIGNLDDRFLRSSPPFVCPNTTFDLGEIIANYGNIYSHNHSANLGTSAGWIQNTANPVVYGSIQSNRRGNVSWSVTSPSSGTGTFGISGASDSYGETMTIPPTTFNVGIKSPTFTDVSCNYPFYGWVEWMKEQGITAGCAANLFCPENLVTRKQMAVFIIKAMGATPSTASYNAYFDDIANDYYAQYINRMYELNITAGCGARAYCPEGPVTRGQMAVFISKAKGWTNFLPPSSTFADVPVSHPFFGFIERMWRNGITSGCSLSLYCPNSYITRGQIAVFISKAF